MNVVSKEAVRRTDLKPGRQRQNDVHNVLKKQDVTCLRGCSYGNMSHQRILTGT